MLYSLHLNKINTLLHILFPMKQFCKKRLIQTKIFVTSLFSTEDKIKRFFDYFRKCTINSVYYFSTHPENQSHLVLTDSSGIQEEAPTLGKPVLVKRDETERLEGLGAGTAKLVGTSKEVILSEAYALLDSEDTYKKMANAVNPYGDGTTSKHIVDIYKKELI